MRQLGPLDRFLCEIDTALRTIIAPVSRCSNRISPAEGISESPLTTKEKQRLAGLMRVNHAGEVSAQALYQGQALTAKLPRVKQQMTEAAEEEVDHLAWCEQRLYELDSQPSKLNLLWYSGSFMIGALAGLAGDKWSLGFVMETERQVSAHLKNHISFLSPQDLKTKAILTTMYDDEAHHASTAQEAGARELPYFIKRLMRGASKLLTQGSYYI